LFVALCVTAYFLSPTTDGSTPAWYSIVPPLLAVTLALLTNRLLLSLGASVFVAGILSAADRPPQLTAAFGGGIPSAAKLVMGAVSDWTNVLILVHVVFIMAMISVMLAGGGLQGLANWLRRYARSARSTKIVTVLTGLAIFIDDYANTMIVGSTLRPVTDQQRISREKLAFLVDATAAPVAGIAIVSTWIGYEVGLLSKTAASLGIDKDGYSIFFDVFLFRFYCVGMIAFVFGIALGGRDFGPMARAERRASKQGKLLDDGARPMTSRQFASGKPHPHARVFAAMALVPMLVVLALFLIGLWVDGGGMVRLKSDPYAALKLSVWRDVLGAGDSIALLAAASGGGLIVSFLFALALSRIPVSAVIRAFLAGVRNSTLPVSVLVLAWSLKNGCDELGTGEFLASALGDRIPPLVFPALVFVVAGLTSFATGTSWGTMAILIPTAIPVAFHVNGGSYGLITVLSIAAVLDGAIFGDHCSPISDTTIMSSTACSCDHMAHVRTQIPYSLAVAMIALSAGYFPAVFGIPQWLGLVAVITAVGGLFLLLQLCGNRSQRD
jgi:Na+/H+ antiporter NhaC